MKILSSRWRELETRWIKCRTLSSKTMSLSIKLTSVSKRIGNFRLYRKFRIKMTRNFNWWFVISRRKMLWMVKRGIDRSGTSFLTITPMSGWKMNWTGRTSTTASIKWWKTSERTTCSIWPSLNRSLPCSKKYWPTRWIQSMTRPVGTNSFTV